jgi:hypothetical protein
MAVEEIVADDFPGRNAKPGEVTRYHLDALRGLTASLEALVEGYQPK